MRSFILVAASLLAVLGSATVLPKREIWQSPFTGEIVAPSTNEVIVEDVAFPFNYKTSSWCQASFEPFEVYLTQGEAPPPFEDVTEDGVMADGSYVYDFGRFVVSHFGQPLPEGSVPPPATLVLPHDVATELDAETTTYLTVLQTFNGCPGHIPVEYSLTSVPVVIGSQA
ncbi:hypothetical protein C8Q76DRAFT_792337 [Earliella scabrosa]|nr:hypothetical protein C8Q76DRAFT_792337 [Earliella scabrosa]